MDEVTTVETNRQYGLKVSFLAFLLSVVALGGCAPSQQADAVSTPVDSILSDRLLNSERIAIKFGGYGIKVLYETDTLRVANLLDGNHVTRTFAMVRYASPLDAALAKPHAEVLAGHSIGNTFKKYGWTIEKRPIYLGEMLPEETYTGIYKMMGNIKPRPLAIWMYRFVVKKGQQEFNYAVISEVYHPDYLTEEDVKRLENDAYQHLKMTPSVKRELQQVSKMMKGGYLPRG